MSNYKFSSEPRKVKLINTRNRKINTMIPAPGTSEIMRNLSLFESRSMHGQLPLVWDRAEDFKIFDCKGNCWIDFTSTIFVANVGHSNKRVTNSIRKVLDNPLYSCYAYPNIIRAEYLEELIRFAGNGFEKGFLMSAGTEATEAALKLMRMNGQKNLKKRLGIISIENNWHGRTMGAQLMSSNQTQKKWIGYSDPDIHHIDFPYPWTLDDLDPKEFLMNSLSKLESSNINLEEDICGFILETFQGWGAIFYPKDYVQEISRICKKNKILLCFDEMQSGFGRTGRNFGFEHYEVSPDLICIGKGMGGGVPISGVLGNSEVMDIPEAGNMSSTHSANPLVCSAALSVINEILDNELVQKAEKKGLILIEKLEKIKQNNPNRVSHVFGKGLIAAILFKDPNTNMPDSEFTSRVAEKCMDLGLLVVHTGRESIKIGPPLTISEDALLEGLEVLEEAIKEIN